ncbi:hypothetical protein Syun_027880 [Stephania yunnanensis]|uniref:Uncharacterized protein n=1 Tax=Stephania yunnanensis TaxID=152371 RepID=A0AAP0HN78_9MAGN
MKTCFFNHYICNLAFLSLTSVLTTEAKMAHRFTQLLALILSLHISSTFAQSLPTHLYTLSQDSDEFFSATAELFERWTEKHGKAYESAKEKERRFENFRRNLKYVAARKSRMDGSSGHAVGLNKFADLSNEEFKQTYLMAKNKTERSLVSNGNVSDSKTREKVVTCDAPAWLDWRKRGVVTPVKNQGACGSCGAFSATGAMEGINAIVTGDLISLSEQELLDCDEFDNGCGGGNMDTAFGWVVLNGGIDSEAGYPYKGFDERCNIYKGIYDGDCSSNPDDVDHAILIVGYGSNGYDSWLWI